MLRVVGSVAATVLISLAVIVGISSYHSTPSAVDSASPTALAAGAKTTELDFQESSTAETTELGRSRKWTPYPPTNLEADRCEGSLTGCLKDVYKSGIFPADTGKKLVEGTTSFLKEKDNFIKDKSLGSAARMLGNLGNVAGAVLPPPGGAILGGVNSLVGVMFPPDPPPVTNEDLMKVMTKGFEQIDEKLGAIDTKLATMSGRLDLIETGVDELRKGQQVVVATLKTVTENLAEILTNQYKHGLHAMMGHYTVYLTKFRQAEETMKTNPSRFSTMLVRAIKYLRKQVDIDSQMATNFGVFGMANMKQILLNVCKASGSNPYVTAIQYHQLVAARYMLFDMMLQNEVFHGCEEGACYISEVAIKDLTIQLRQQVDSYPQLLDEINAECVEAGDFGGFGPSNPQHVALVDDPMVKVVSQLDLRSLRTPHCVDLTLPGYFDNSRFTCSWDGYRTPSLLSKIPDTCPKELEYKPPSEWSYPYPGARPKRGLQRLAEMTDADIAEKADHLARSLEKFKENPLEWVEEHKCQTQGTYDNKRKWYTPAESCHGWMRHMGCYWNIIKTPYWWNLGW